MITLDSYYRHGERSPTMRSSRVLLRWIRDLAVGILTLVTFLAVAFIALYLRARLGMPSL